MTSTETIVLAETLDLTIISKSYDVGNLIMFPKKVKFSREKLAIIVPFRDAYTELDSFAPHMTKYFNARKIPYHIFVINQTDNLRFNRGALVNIGYVYTLKKFDYFVQHDVDYLPLNPKIPYDFEKYRAMLLVPNYLRPGCISSKVNFS